MPFFSRHHTFLHLQLSPQVLFLRIAHSPFIKKYVYKKKNNNNGVNIELGKPNRLKALCIMQIKKNEINKLCVNKQ